MRERQVIVNGVSVPTFLYGTAWKEETTQLCVKKALEAGFRGIDTANQRKHYYEAGVGAALREAYEAGLLTRKVYSSKQNSPIWPARISGCPMMGRLIFTLR